MLPTENKASLRETLFFTKGVVQPSGILCFSFGGGLPVYSQTKPTIQTRPGPEPPPVFFVQIVLVFCFQNLKISNNRFVQKIVKCLRGIQFIQLLVFF